MSLEHQPFFYVIEHIPSSKLYMGSKWSKDPNRLANPALFMIEGGYLTSSNTVKNLIQSDGIDSFKIKEIVLESEVSNQYSSIFKYEVARLKAVDAANNPLYLNKSDGCYLTEQVSDRYYWDLRKNDHKIKFTDAEKGMYWLFQEYDLNLIIRSKEDVAAKNEVVNCIRKFLKTRSFSAINPEEVGLPQTYTKWTSEHLTRVLFDLENNFGSIRRVFRKRFNQLS